MPSVLQNSPRSQVNPGSKAHRQGVEPGDQVISINSSPVKNIQEAQQLVRSASNNLVLQLRRPSRPTFLVDSRPSSQLRSQSQTQEPSLDHPQQQRLHTSTAATNGNSSTHNSYAKAVSVTSVESIGDKPNTVPSEGSTHPDVTLNFQIQPEIKTDLPSESAQTKAGKMDSSAYDGQDVRTNFTTPSSPSFKARGAKPQVWSPTSGQGGIPREYYGITQRDQLPSSNLLPPPGSAGEERSAHNGVCSPSSSSSGIVSGTNSERTDDLTLGQEAYSSNRNPSFREQELGSAMFKDRSREFNRLPRSQSPTVTLLQRARETQSGRTLHPAESPSDIRRRSSPENQSWSTTLPAQGKSGNLIRHTYKREPVKYEGTGPTNEQGVPIGLRSAIKEDQQHDWYKKMFRAIHRPEDETDFVLVKYQQPKRNSRGYSPTPRNPYLSDAYMSEPEYNINREDNYGYSAQSDAETSRDYGDYSRTHSLPRHKKEDSFDPSAVSAVPTPASHKYHTSPPIRTDSTKSYNPQPSYQTQPKRIDNYEPGKSSISMQEAVQDRDWKRQTKLYNPPAERPEPRPNYSSGKNNLLPEKVIYRSGTGREISPEEQEVREIYREMQKGGEVPFNGLRRPIPPKSKARNASASNRSQFVYPLPAQARLEPKEMSDDEFRALADYRRYLQQPRPKHDKKTRFSFFKSEYLAENSANPYRNAEKGNTLSTRPSRTRAMTREEFFGLPAQKVTLPENRRKPRNRCIISETKSRKRASSALSKTPQTAAESWLKKLNDDLDSLALIVAPRYDLKSKLDQNFRDQLSRQVAQWKIRNHGLSSRVFHSSACGTIFSSCCSLLFDAEERPPRIPVSKTEDFQNPQRDQDRLERIYGGTVHPKEFVPYRERKLTDDVVQIHAYKRAEKVRNMTRKMFSLSKEGKTLETPDPGRVHRLSQKFETWQKVRSASASPTPVPALVGPKFTYMNTSLNSAWITKHGQGIFRSRSLPRINNGDSKSGMSISKSFHSNTEKESYQPPRIEIKYGIPQRHVGFDLLEASLDFDDKISLVSSFHGSALDDFRLTPSPCGSNYSTDAENGYRSKDAEIGPITGPEVYQMESDIDRISAPPSKKPLTDSATLSRKVSLPEASSHYTTPVRSKSIDRQRSGTSDYEDDFDLVKEYQRIDEIYEKEREKRERRKVQEEERRRHNYFPTVAQSPVKTDRYDSVYEDPFRLSGPGRPRSVSPGILNRNYGRSSSNNSDYQDMSALGPARAVYAFRAQNPRELSFRLGDIVRITKVLDDQWIEGECNGRAGIAPSSYLESIRKEKSNRGSEVQVKAKYDFNAQNAVEMSLRKGETATVIRRVDQNWYEGKTGARRGIFPVAYVEVLQQLSSPKTTTATYIQPQFTQAPIKPARQTSPVPAHNPVRRKSSVVEEGSDRVKFGDTVLNEFKTQVSLSPTPMAQLRRNSAPRSSIDELLIPPPPTTSVQEELDLLRREPERCRVLYTYRSQNEDELSLMEGEVITMTEKCDDGWYRGCNKRGDQGYFPGNYVQVLVS